MMPVHYNGRCGRWICVLFLLLLPGHPAEAQGDRGKLSGLRFVERMTIVEDITDSMRSYTFEYLTDIYVAPSHHLYVLDGGRNIVYEFDPDGRYERRYEFRRLEPKPRMLTEVAVDSFGRVFVYSLEDRMIFAATPSGEFLYAISIYLHVGDMEIGIDDHLYIVGYAGYVDYRPAALPNTFLTDAGPMIRRIDATGILTRQFCARRPVGNQGRLCISESGHIYFIFVYPHEIRKFSPQLRYMGTFTRDVHLIREPDYRRARLDTPQGPGAERELEVWDNLDLYHLFSIALQDGALLNFLEQTIRGKRTLYIDAFDANGVYRGAIPAGETGLPIPIESYDFGLRGADRYGNVYLVLQASGKSYLKQYHVEPIYR